MQRRSCVTYVGVEAEYDRGAQEDDEVEGGLQQALEAAFYETHFAGCAGISVIRIEG